MPVSLTVSAGVISSNNKLDLIEKSWNALPKS
jgi:hypothetical protein